MADEFITKSQRHPAELWARIADYRHANKIKTEVEAVRQLLERGLAPAIAKRGECA